MNTTREQVETARAELARSYGLPDYEAVDVAWLAIVKAGNTRSESNERKRLAALLGQADEAAVRTLLFRPEVDALLNLQPPLETILTNAHERIDATRTATELNTVRHARANEPKVALLALAEIMKRMRNRRAHGFKTPYVPRDQEILKAAATVLRAIGEVALRATDA